MIGIVVKSDERRNSEARVLRQFDKNYQTASSSDWEQAEYIAAKTGEAYAELKRMEDKQ